MLITNVSVYTCDFSKNAPYRSTTYTHHFPGAGHTGGKLTHKQTLMKVTNSGATTKSNFNLR